MPWAALAAAAVAGGSYYGSTRIGRGGPPTSPIEGLAQQDWSWFQNNILPEQQKLFSQAMSPSTYQKNISQAESDVDASYAGLPTAFKRNLAGMGITPTAAQTASFNKVANVNKGLAEAGAANEARAATTAENRGILGV